MKSRDAAKNLKKKIKKLSFKSLSLGIFKKRKKIFLRLY